MIACCVEAANEIVSAEAQELGHRPPAGSIAAEAQSAGDRHPDGGSFNPGANPVELEALKDAARKEGAELRDVEMRDTTTNEEAKEKMDQRREPRRGSLTKPPPGGGTGAGGRRAEIPVKGPQYHLQSQVIEQEYGSGSGPVPVVRTSSAPPPAMPSQNHNGGYSGRGTPTIQPVKSAPSPYQHQQQQQRSVYSQQNGS